MSYTMPTTLQVCTGPLCSQSSAFPVGLELPGMGWCEVSRASPGL